MGSAELEENFNGPSTGQGNSGSYGYHVMSNTNPGSSWTRVTGYITGRSDTASGNFETDANYFRHQLYLIMELGQELEHVLYLDGELQKQISKNTLIMVQLRYQQ